MLRSSILVLVLLLCSSANARSQSIFFAPPTYLFAGAANNAIAADLNGDGKADLVSAEGTVLLGNADGTFHTGTPWTINGQPPTSDVIAVGDFNGDGKPDLLVTVQNYFYVLLGNGDGTFQAPITTTTGVSVWPIFVADVNGDGKPDVILASTVTLVYVGNGDGTFALESKNPTFSGNMLGIGDFNHDGKIDILLAPAANQVGVLLGNGDGTFQSSVVTTTVSGLGSPWSGLVAIADLNSDHVQDVVVSGTPFTFVLLGVGDGTFTASQIATPANYLGQLAVADVSGDGKPDLILAFSVVTQVFLGKGDGTFTPGDEYFIPQQRIGSPVPINIADFNGDGKQDIATDGTLLLGNGDGTFQGNSASTQTSYISTGVEFNLNGITDMAIGLAGSVAILSSDGKGKFPSVHTYALPQQSKTPVQIATADVNGDGKLDLVVLVGPVPGVAGWTLDILLGNGDGTFRSATIALEGNTNSIIAALVPMIVADFNGDHKPDVAVLDDSGANVFLGNGDGTFKSIRSLSSRSAADFVRGGGFQ